MYIKVGGNVIFDVTLFERHTFVDELVCRRICASWESSFETSLHYDVSVIFATATILSTYLDVLFVVFATSTTS